MEVIHHTGSDFTRIFEILHYQQTKYANSKALNEFDEQWQGYSISDTIQLVEALACWLRRQDYKPGERIMLVPVLGSAAWVFIDFACQLCGLVTVPVHATSRQEDFLLIAQETESKFCITADKALSEKVKLACGSNLPVFHLEVGTPDFFNWKQEPPSKQELDELHYVSKHIAETDWVTILYTSGSSGISKGVPLTHRNIIHNIKAILPMLPLETEHSVLSFLPFSHILERMACYGYMAFGVAIYFSRNRDSVAHDFLSVRPYFCTSVPRVLEKMYDYLQAQLLTRNAIKRKLIGWAFAVAARYKSEKQNTLLYGIQLWLVRMLVLRHWRKRLGGRLRYMVVGAASLRPEIGRMLSAAGVQVVEGYGMTETSPLISINRFEPGLNRFGTVGMIIPGVEVKIDEPDEAGAGEILVGGPNVMTGYFKRPELNAEVFTADGWLRTGDVGLFEKKRFLKITDRKKDIFKTSTGKYIAPQHLQSQFCQSAFIQQCLILGFNQPFVTALIVPNFNVLVQWCDQEHIHWTAPQYMIHNIKVRARMQQEVEAINLSISGYERVINFVLCPEEWTIERGELTPSLKPIRQKIMANYQSEIEKMYTS
jgi:long-chain acyl-CoA synthetase